MYCSDVNESVLVNCRFLICETKMLSIVQCHLTYSVHLISLISFLINLGKNVSGRNLYFIRNHPLCKTVTKNNSRVILKS